MRATRTGSGPPLLLVHGLGGSHRSWDPILAPLAAKRSVIAVDLPGHGGDPAEGDSGTFAGLVRSTESFIAAEGLQGIAAVGSSMGARLVLELARRGRVGGVVALDPGGFWRGWERAFFQTTLRASILLLRGLAPTLPALARNGPARALLLAQLTARPFDLDPGVITTELQSLIATPTFDDLVRDLARGSEQEGPAARASRPVTIGWGREDRLCLPRQAPRAQAAFPEARLHWFEGCGHFPMWDCPAETVAVILEGTA